MTPKIAITAVIVLFLFLLTCSQSTPKQENIQPSSTDVEALRQALQRLEEDPLLIHGVLAFSVISNKDGKTVLEKNSQKTLAVASVMKAITTATALATLGEDFKFQTELAYSGELTKEGVLKGNLYIKGGGDPTLGSQLLKNQSLQTVLSQWTNKLKLLNISRIEGRVIADESLFERNPTPSQWIWGDMGNYFGAPAGALNVLDNTYKLYFQPTALGQPAKILRTEPNMSHIQFVNEVKTAQAGTGDMASISGAPHDQVRYVSGTIPLGGTFSIKGAIPDPALFLAEQLHQKIKESKIAIAEPPTTTWQLSLQNKKWETQRILIHRHESPYLKDIVNYTNIHSVNLFAEALLKGIGLQQEKEASTQAGIKAVTAFWQKQGIDIDGFYMQDGSGLSLSNGITAAQLTAILHKISQSAYSKVFQQSLPIAGVSGTMYGVANEGKARNNLRAKSGGMTRVQAYAGYFTSASGKQMSFAIITNRYSGEYSQIKKKLSNLMSLMVESL